LFYSPTIIRVIKDDEMGGAYGKYGGEETCIQGFGGENPTEKDKWEDLMRMGW
jgi:hypothetical protein